MAVAAVFGALIGAAPPAWAGFTEQGNRLIGSGVNGDPPGQGFSVALSGDGNTAIIGGPWDDATPCNCQTGASWVFTRSNGVWTQQGPKLGNPTAYGTRQGTSVALSADGNTVMVGAPGIAGSQSVGTAYVFTRSGGVWSQQGPTLVPSDDNGFPNFGSSVALSADGNTALIGGFGDAADAGAAWIFTRSNGVWSQQGAKLHGTNPAGAASDQGWSVALSADGNTAVVGGYFDNNGIGAIWIFTRSKGAWTQQGPKLVGTGTVGQAYQGYSVSLSHDGNTALVGGWKDDNETGAAWVFTRSNGTWTQLGAKLVGSGASPPAAQGTSVALSGDGSVALVGGSQDSASIGAVWPFIRAGGALVQNGQKFRANGFTGTPYLGASLALSGNGSTAIVGGYGDNSTFGAAWVFTGPAVASHDFDGDGKSDIFWRNTNGTPALWLMNGGSISGTGSFGTGANTYAVIGQRDFNGDGKADILWRDTGGNLAMWFMNGATLTSSVQFATVASTWTVRGTADMNGDGKGDLLWQDASGDVAIWFMNGSTISSATGLGTLAPAGGWSIVASTTGNILWRHSSGALALWQVNGSTVNAVSLASITGNWVVQAFGDFNGDGVADILWRDSTSGTVAIWFLNAGGAIQSTSAVGTVPATWAIQQTGDYNGDGMSDILWVDGSGNVAIWFMNGATISSTASVGDVGTTWQVQNLNDN